MALTSRDYWILAIVFAILVIIAWNINLTGKVNEISNLINSIQGPIVEIPAGMQYWPYPTTIESTTTIPVGAKLCCGNADCNDGNPCTKDECIGASWFCIVKGKCINTLLSDTDCGSTTCQSKTCKSGRCIVTNINEGAQCRAPQCVNPYICYGTQGRCYNGACWDYPYSAICKDFIGCEGCYENNQCYTGRCTESECSQTSRGTHTCVYVRNCV